ncbi:unnamed protein product [Rotaria sp. Silwood1]|nr:unnamed protein product [Rotaria sp. Silwood1]
MLIRLIISFILIYSFTQSFIFALHLHGHYSTKEFFRLLTKFGIQKTDQHRPDDTFGYIYGNITLDCPINNCSLTKTILFLILDYDYFLPLYKKQRMQSCSDMMKQIQTIAFHRQCNVDGTEDFWRHIPCQQDQLCSDEDQPHNVIHNQQFTFKIRDINQPRFWYLSLISCYWDPTTCHWEKVDDNIQINYDIWIVNGNPEAKTRDNRFEYHFSFDIYDLVEVYSICILFYLFIPLPFLIIKMRSLIDIKHPILISYFLFQLLFFIGNTLNLLHYFIFAYNGIGVYILIHIGNLITIIGESILILLLLFIAKGWLVNTPVLRQGKKTVMLFVLYTIACCSCYILSIMTINPVTDSNHYQTFANYFSLLFRCFVMLLFVFELKETTQEEKNLEKLQFFHHFGACCMVWFIYPTALIFIMSFVTELYRVKLIISVVTLVNFLSILIISYILFSPKTFINLPKLPSIKHDGDILNKTIDTNGYHKSILTEHDDDDDEEEEIEIYGPSHLLLNNTAKCQSNANDNNSITISKRLKSKNITSITTDEARSMKSFNKNQKTNDVKKKRRIHSDSNDNNSTKKLKPYSHSDLEYITSTSSNKNEIDIHHHHMINNKFCNACGECFGEMISCNTCSATFHILCINPSLSKEDISKDSYFCENCRTITKTQEDFINKNKQQKIILPFSFNPKKNLHGNSSKQTQQYHSKLGQLKLPTASNGQSLIQPSGEIKFRAITTNNEKNKSLSLSSSNLKRKRIYSSSIKFPIDNSIKISNTHLDTLHRFFFSCQPEEFHGPSLILNDSIYNHNQKYCFICRKSSLIQGPSIHCDYCSLTYHLDCLTPQMTTLPLLNEEWMCPNHIEPILDHYLTKKNQFSTSERVKIYHQYSPMEQNIILQEFTHIKQTKDNLLSNKINNYQFERINISQIPKTIEDFYFKANTKQQNICKSKIIDIKEETEEKIIQTNLVFNQTSFAYDPCVWDILQAILDHIVNNHIYEFSSIDKSFIKNDYQTEYLLKEKCNTFNRIDTLLQALNEPNCTLDECKKNKINNCDILISTSDEELLEQKQISTSLTNTFSHLIDLSQFHLSHAALIHLQSQNVIYIRKYVIWFGSSSLNDICLKNFNHSHTCQYISERHACLYYDRKNNLFELLNYSEYGTIVNDFRYGLNIITDNNNKQENESLPKCYCLTKSYYHSSWDGSAQIEQGTVIKIGCHDFLFYRHIVR